MKQAPLAGALWWHVVRRRAKRFKDGSHKLPLCCHMVAVTGLSVTAYLRVRECDLGPAVLHDDQQLRQLRFEAERVLSQPMSQRMSQHRQHSLKPGRVVG